MGRVLPIRFYARPAVVVARELLGARIVSSVDGLLTVGRIVETEAYTGPDDEASHAAARIGRTARNAAMFGPPGSAYVYRIYGVHWCLNVVTDTVDHPAAVLIRAIEPITGFDVMHERRGRRTIARCLIGRGPGNLARALGIDGALNGQSLRVAPLRLLRGDAIDDAAIATGPRIGVTRAVEEPLRFFIRGNPSVSGRRTHSRPPEQ
jgi:DNA-3-methyladenine glycosylase